MKKAFASFLILLTAAVTTTAQIQPFKTGDRVAFVGNSITEQGYYESYIWLYYMLHFPTRHIVILNRGIGGDRAQEIYNRFDDDVLTANADVICLTFGMNDSGYFEFLKSDADSTAQVRVKNSRHYYDLIEEKLKKLPNVKKILIIGSPFDETAKIKGNVFPGKVKVMEQIAAFQTQAAKDNHWGLVDLMHPMTEIDIREQQKDSTFTLTGNDRIHPGNSGHLVMAWLFLKAQGLDTLSVADIAIDAKSLKLDRAGNCKITNLTNLTAHKSNSNGAIDGSTLRFDYLAGSLPFPVDTVARLWGNPHRMSEAIPVMPFYSGFNREMLRISGLGAGNYQLMIDGEKIGAWTSAEFAEGINLAKLTNTPQYEQAMSVLELNEERMGLESKLRAYNWLQYDYLRDRGMKFKDNLAALDSVNRESIKNWFVGSKKDNYRAARYPVVRATWQKEMEMIVNEIYVANQPKAHTVEIKPLAQ